MHPQLDTDTWQRYKYDAEVLIQGCSLLHTYVHILSYGECMSELSELWRYFLPWGGYLYIKWNSRPQVLNLKKQNSPRYYLLPQGKKKRENPPCPLLPGYQIGGGNRVWKKPILSHLLQWATNEPWANLFFPQRSNSLLPLALWGGREERERESNRWGGDYEETGTPARHCN